MCIYLRGEREGKRERVRKRANLDKLAPILARGPIAILAVKPGGYARS